MIAKKAHADVKKVQEQARMGILRRQPGKTMASTFESTANRILNDARDSAGRAAVRGIGSSNNIISMIQAGSKGSFINLAQIVAFVGQQNVEGQRIANGFRGRALPHFMKYDGLPRAKGFVDHSYSQGLQPAEFFFHAMGGREGLIDTAVKTSETGYIQRRLIKAMESIKVHSDHTARSELGDVIQLKKTTN